MRRFLVFLMVILASGAHAASSDQTIFEIGSDTTPIIRMSVDQGEIASRYQIVTDPNGNVVGNDIQDRALLNLKVAFFNNRIRIEMTGMTGNSFAVSFNKTGLISDDSAFDFYLRRLFITAAPTRGVELSMGSFGPEFGAGTENTSIDADGYIVGYRARVEIRNGSLVVTTGYLGDFKDPNVFNRFGRLDELNYLQAVLNYQLMQYVRSSLEFDRIGDHDYVRPALKINVDQWTRFADALAVETLVPIRNGDSGAFAFSAGVSKRIKDVFGVLVPGRDLLLSTQYQHAQLQADLPFGDHVIAGNSMRFQIRIAKLADFPGGSLDAFFDYVQGLDVLKRHRLEIGIAVRLN